MIRLKTAGAAIFALCITQALLAEEVPSDGVFFSGEAHQPYSLYLGDEKGWEVPVAAVPLESYAGRVSVEEAEPPGAKRFTWIGRGDAQVYLKTPEPQDLSEYLASDAALVIQLRVDAKPRRAVTLRMGCGYPCAANADITQLLKRLPENEWLRVAIDLKCFVDLGARLERVETPFLLLTGGRLSVSIADVRLIRAAGEGATVSC